MASSGASSVGRMKDRLEEVVRLLMREIGKALSDPEKGVRSDDRLHPRHDRRPEGPRPRVVAIRDPACHWPDSAGAAGRGALHGAFNYPLNENFTTLIRALIMGNPVLFKPPKLGVLLHQPLLDVFGDSFPPGVIGTVYGEGPTVISPLSEVWTGRRPGLHRIEPRGGRSQASASAASPPAVGAGSRGQERGDLPAYQLSSAWM
jgi:delta 1-pyrroline-5-carboxylate dehydrogenase